MQNWTRKETHYLPSGTVQFEAERRKDGALCVTLDLEESQILRGIWVESIDEETVDPELQKKEKFCYGIKKPHTISLVIESESQGLTFIRLLSEFLAELKCDILSNFKETAPNLSEWAKRVKERDGECQKCGSTKELEAHHIESRTQAKELELALSNGITLCRKCHTEFHHRFGKTFTYRKQLLAFLHEKEVSDLNDPYGFVEKRVEQKIGEDWKVLEGETLFESDLSEPTIGLDDPEKTPAHSE